MGSNSESPILIRILDAKIIFSLAVVMSIVV